jgi:hypothetical protein
VQQRTAAGVDVAQADAYVPAADRLGRQGDRRDQEQYDRDHADAARVDADDSQDSAECREAWAYRAR